MSSELPLIPAPEAESRPAGAASPDAGEAQGGSATGTPPHGEGAPAAAGVHPAPVAALAEPPAERPGLPAEVAPELPLGAPQQPGAATVQAPRKRSRRPPAAAAGAAVPGETAPARKPRRSRAAAEAPVAPPPAPPERIARETIAAALAEAAGTTQRAVDILEAKLAVPRGELIARLGATLRVEPISMDSLHSLLPDFEALPFTQAAQRECVALRDPQGRLLLVIGDPFDAVRRAWAEAAVAEDFDWRLAHPDDLRAFLSQHEESMRAMDSVLDGNLSAKAVDADSGELLSITSISEGDSPVVKLVSSTIYDALKAGTSDVHFETGGSGLTIKYRLDGVLATVGAVQGSDIAEQVLSRIKVMAELDISERRIPQDGRFKVLIKGRAVDFRVSVMPSIHGEDAVLRILDKHGLVGEQQALTLESLGFDPEVMTRIRMLARKPYGMLLVTGPTGSGKSTTLYGALTEINSGQDKIITIEDPVEYQLNGVLQIPVNEKKGLTFSRGLRSILRHDPDIILIGEMRDAETAQIAVQAALTGHLVFTTVHANNVFDVIGRATHMGIEPYAFVSAVNGIVAQRLMRKICPECAVDQTPDDELLELSGLERAAVQGWMFRVGRGCGRCRGTGYQGRKAIAEILLLNDEVREMILRNEPVRLLREAAARNGTRTLRESALDSVRRGETTLQEINRVTFVG